MTGLETVYVFRAAVRQRQALSPGAKPRACPFDRLRAGSERSRTGVSPCPACAQSACREPPPRTTIRSRLCEWVSVRHAMP